MATIIILFCLNGVDSCQSELTTRLEQWWRPILLPAQIRRRDYIVTRCVVGGEWWNSLEVWLGWRVPDYQIYSERDGRLKTCMW